MSPSAALGAAVIGLTLAATAHPALGFADPYKYYSADNPLQAYDDGVAQAQMHGKFFVEDATYLRNNTNQRDPRPGGDAVFERTQSWYYQPGSDGYEWVLREVDQGPKTDDDTWYFQYDHSAFVASAQKGRM